MVCISKRSIVVPSLGTVNVVYGAHDLDMDLAGFNVGEIQYALRDVLNVGMDAVAYIDGRPAAPSHRLLPRNRIEFMSGWGRKGAGDTRPTWETPDGGIQLYCSDCRLILPKLGHCADAAIVDPPYNIGFRYNSYKDRMVWAEYLAWQEDVMVAAKNALKSDASILYLNYPETAAEMWARLRQHYDPIEWINWIYHTHTGGTPLRRGSRAWLWLAQGNPYIGNEALRGQYRNPNDKRIREQIQKGLAPIDYDWWWYEQVKNVSPEKTSHPCQLPIEMVERLVRLTCPIGGTVIDPFMGSGTTGEACVRSGRRFIGIEMDGEYFQIAVERIERALRKKECIPLAVKNETTIRRVGGSNTKKESAQFGQSLSPVS
jgi:site-specific DNA-methyltransferase (adenine-specific)